MTKITQYLPIDDCSTPQAWGHRLEELWGKRNKGISAYLARVKDGRLAVEDIVAVSISQLTTLYKTPGKDDKKLACQITDLSRKIIDARVRKHEQSLSRKLAYLFSIVSVIILIGIPLLILLKRKDVQFNSEIQALTIRLDHHNDVIKNKSDRLITAPTEIEKSHKEEPHSDREKSSSEEVSFSERENSPPLTPEISRTLTSNAPSPIKSSAPLPIKGKQPSKPSSREEGVAEEILHAMASKMACYKKDDSVLIHLDEFKLAQSHEAASLSSEEYQIIKASVEEIKVKLQDFQKNHKIAFIKENNGKISVDRPLFRKNVFTLALKPKGQPTPEQLGFIVDAQWLWFYFNLNYSYLDLPSFGEDPDFMGLAYFQQLGHLANSKTWPLMDKIFPSGSVSKEIAPLGLAATSKLMRANIHPRMIHIWAQYVNNSPYAN